MAMKPCSCQAQSSKIVEFLSQPAAYPANVAHVELRETHISWVFLTGQYAYKLKKPVRFDFLDFSTLELRKQACDSELRLNRRLSSGVYLRVVPIYQDADGRLSLDGSPDATRQIIDWVVKMRQLDDGKSFDGLLKRKARDGSLDVPVRAVATHLARFYSAQAPLTVRTTEFRENLRRHIGENQHDLSRTSTGESESNSINFVHSCQLRYLTTHECIFDNRVRDGRVVDGHGDLRPEHIYANHPTQVIDCIEFNSDYRSNDICDELSFLAMECDRLGANSVGRVLFDEYTATSDDCPPKGLIAFYKAYRACVRAKVAALRSQQQTTTAADVSQRVEHEYLSLAEGYVSGFTPRMVLLVGGLMGSGKSTLAEYIAKGLSAEMISSDIVRRQVAVKTSNRVAVPGYGTGSYSMASRLANYRTLMSQAESAMVRNGTVVLDATFSTQAMRKIAVEFAESWRALLIQVECLCPRDVALERIAGRAARGDSASDAQPEYYDLQLQHAEPALSGVPLVEVDTTLAVGHQYSIVLEHLRGLLHHAEIAAHPQTIVDK